MGTSPGEMRAFVIRQGELWNAGDRAGFVASYHEIAPAGFAMEFPVGGPIHRGWDALDDLWNNYQTRIRVSYPIVACGDNGEMAVLEQIDAEVEGRVVSRHSIHSYVCADEGMLVRYFADSPQPNDAAQATRAFLTRQSDLWNLGEREQFFAAYTAFTGADFDIEFPIGAPPHPGPQMLQTLWNGYQADVKLRYRHVYVTDSNEAAICVGNERIIDGQISVNNSLEFYRFDERGMHVRYFHEGAHG